MKTIHFLIATDSGKAAASVRNKEGKLPYNLLFENREYYICYSDEELFETLLKELEKYSESLVKCCRSYP